MFSVRNRCGGFFLNSPSQIGDLPFRRLNVPAKSLDVVGVGVIRDRKSTDLAFEVRPFPLPTFAVFDIFFEPANLLPMSLDIGDQASNPV
jgi:hypothetical protein